jgi:lambda family phage portal protein
MANKRRTRRKVHKSIAKTSGERGYVTLAGSGITPSDWNPALIGEDADIWMSAYMLTARMRDLFRSNPVYVKYRELLWSNIFGENGIMLRMKIKETEDRVVHTPDEARALLAYEKRINRIRDWAAKQDGRTAEHYRAFSLADQMERSSVDAIVRGKATIQAGSPDVFANLMVERAWAEWQRAENCDIRGKRNYHTIRQLRLINGVRDGDFFIRLIRDPKQRVNRFGFTLQMISSEWCDRFYADVLPNGNVVIMGIEYEMTEWGLGKPVAFYFIKRQPRDWQYASLSQAFGIGSYNRSLLRAPIKTEDIIHYARPVDAEGTRPAPWAVSTMVKMRMLDQTELAHVIASREAACKTGFYYSDILPEGGWAEVDPPDPTTGISTEPLAPGETRPLKFGVKYQERDPKFPTSTFGEFRKSMGQSGTAGMPGGDYNILFNDLENINFSAGRLGRLDSSEMAKMIQRFDIDTAERPIFEAWLEMALITGAIALPLQKFDKFNNPLFQGRRWSQVDEIKAVNAAALRVANKLSSRNRECAEEGIDFEENALELAEEEMLLGSLGLETTTTVEGAKRPQLVDDETNGGTDVETDPEAGGTAKPAPTKKPGNQSNGNGKHEELEFARS